MRFAPVIAALAEKAALFVEVSPHPVLTTAVQDLAQRARAAVVETLRRDDGGLGRFMLSLAGAHVAGAAIDWDAVLAGTRPRRVALPTYAFQRERCWPDPSAGGHANLASAGLVPAGHPLLAARIDLPGRGECVLTGRLSLTAQPWLGDHRVGGVAVVPGAVVAELVVRAGDETGCGRVAELLLQAPLILPGEGGVHVQVAVGAAGPDGARDVAVYAVPESGGEWTCNATGTLVPDPGELGEPGEATAAWPPPGAEPVAVQDFYADMSGAGYEYGPAFQGVRGAWRRGEEVFAEVALPPELRGEAGRFVLHPVLLDAALQAMGFAEVGGEVAEGRVLLPFTFTGLSVLAGGASAARVRIVPKDDGGASIELSDPAGAPLAVLDSLGLRAVALGDLGATGSAARDDSYHLDWTPVPLRPADAGRCVVAGPDPLGVAAGLRRAGLGVESFPDLDAVTGAPDVLVVCAPADTAAAPQDAAPGHAAPASAPVSAAVAARDAAATMLATVQRWLRDDRYAETRLVVVTRDAVSCPEGARPRETPPDPVQAAVWGLLRSVRAEAPGRVSLIDVDGGPVPWAGVLAAEDEPEIAVRGRAALAPRLERIVPGASGVALIPPPGTGWRVDTTAPGSLEAVTIVPAEADRGPLGHGDVRVEVHAAGVNFRDVLVGLGMYPDPGAMGNEAAGVVTEVGPGVTRLRPGDHVLGFMRECWGPAALADERVLAKMPDAWSFEEAAAVPVAYVTALYGLIDLGRLAAGETVVVHAATGGVGTAAVQVARWAGARVLGTASEGKWPVLREMGLAQEEIASSRTAEFAGRFRRAAPEGVDVVLNCLAGELVDASLGLLRPGGRLVEMGKTDLRDPGELADRHPGVEYVSFDAAALDLDRMGGLLARVMDLFAQGALALPPVTTADIRQAPRVLRWMSQAGHVGKIVLRTPRALDPDGTVLITGGTGTLGRLLARHLVTAHGARRLLLVSRSGKAAPGVEDDLADLGADVRVEACDVADRAALAALLRDVRLTAVIHAAGVLDDGMVLSQDEARLARVLRPKIDGAVNLDELTRSADLAWFVMFSSVTGVIGGPGQAGYAAANAFLDALAQRRRAEGLPGLSLAWGIWAPASGMTAHLTEADRTRMRAGGVAALSAEDGLALFDAALRADVGVQVPARFDLARWRETAADEGVPALLRDLIAAPARRTAAAVREEEPDLRAMLAGRSREERESIVTGIVVDNVAVVLGHRSTAGIDLERGFFDIGFDSLTAVELRNRLNAATGLRLPVSYIYDNPTPETLVAHLLATCGADDPAPASILSELEGLEQAVAAAAPEQDLRAELRERLHVLLSKLEDPPALPVLD
ncbi:SDR family NAD(P)-dependent oxidoreductase [Thermocatellispora tengchongensis]|uniref:SDR family NAD(P)-dependent oxidoreductase n=1 Tax=Thermocatellispora tengchongensis TaxID=1073253 RepID=UPI0036404893